MEEQTLLSLLLSEKNISGIWVVIGATLALFGVLSNNFFENRRRKTDRKHALVRETYFGGVEYINYYFHMIANVNKLGADGQLNVDANITGKYYNLFMVASADVIEAFTNLFQVYTSTTFKLGMIIVDIKTLEGKINLANGSVENGLKMMNLSNDSKQEYNDKGFTDKAIWETYQRQYDEGLKMYDESSKNLDDFNKEFLEVQIQLLKESLSAMISASPKMYYAIITMRADLDRELNKTDSKTIKSSIDAMLVQLKSDVDGFVSELDNRIQEMTAETD